ncbi:SDR family oxidoreductase [Marinicella sediminis]|uniref:SDR family oxidoreductase n=1 Tax=Marinicella sediminis TaxID=1792834 RepID=A0ABV7J6C7_9GAMM|nr:SDR family oxidoreductase [Marinicella sediminis]
MNKRVIVITGAASGLGLALAQKAAERGFDVAVADVQQEAGELAARELVSRGVDARFFHCDVSQTDALLTLKNQVIEHFGQVDVLVNNAGVGSQGMLTDTTEEEWQRQWQINVMGVVRGCQAFIPQLKKQSGSAVVNVASFAALALAPGMASYNVAKAGVLALSETLRGELAADGVHVAVACPAFFKTNLVDSMQESDDQIKQQINRWMERSKYTAEDVATMILDAVKQKQFMVLCDQQTRWQYRIARWFPNYFYKQKLKMMKRMFR